MAGEPLRLELEAQELGQGHHLSVETERSRHRGEMAEVDGHLGVIEVSGLGRDLVHRAELAHVGGAPGAQHPRHLPENGLGIVDPGQEQVPEHDADAAVGDGKRAGIAPGDVILAFNGDLVETSEDLPPLVGANPPGSEATVLISRNGSERSVDVVLDALNQDDEEVLASTEEEEDNSNLLGLSVAELTSDERRQMGAPDGGVRIARVESDEAWRAGLRAGDVILMINNRDVEGINGFEGIVEDLEAGKAVALRVWRDGQTTFFAYTPKDENVG